MNTNIIFLIVAFLGSTFQATVHAKSTTCSVTYTSAPTAVSESESIGHLLSFEAQQNDRRAVELLWIVSGEFPLAYYQVQSSIDGRNWNDKEKVFVEDNTKKQYTSVDRSASRYPNDQTIFYRLIMVDDTETQYFSDIRPVRLQSKASNEFQVFPNPDNGVFQINLPIIPQGECEVLITNTKGEVVHRQIVDNKTGTINLNELTAGNYWLGMMTPQKVYTQKLVLMD